MVKIAYLIICHRDPPHIGRLVRRLCANGAAAFIHVDAKVAIGPFAKEILGIKNAVLIRERVAVYWGGFSAVSATMSLLISAFRHSAEFDRFVLIQGADYPLKSDTEIQDFFARHENTEFIRAANCSTAVDKYLYSKARYKLFFDRPNLIKRVINRLTFLLDLSFRRRPLVADGKIFDVYWGCAQWALTRRGADAAMRFFSVPAVAGYFRHIFPADETFFQTAIFNSPLALQTTTGAAEIGITNLVQLRNLHYFEYPKNIKIFTEDDFEMLKVKRELFIRKVESAASAGLLDLIDRGQAPIQ